MAININKTAQKLTPVFNPIQYDCEDDEVFSYIKYFLLLFDEDLGTSVSQTDFRKSHTNKGDYFRINFESTLQDYMTTQPPTPSLRQFKYSGKGWTRKFYGVIQTDAPDTEFIPESWTFNASLSRRDWVKFDSEGDSRSVIPNSTKGGGRFLSEFTERTVQDASEGTTAITNGVFEEEEEELDGFPFTEYNFTDYTHIGYSNNNSQGYFVPTALSTFIDQFGVLVLRLKALPTLDLDFELAEGDIIDFTLDPSSQAGGFYGTILDGEWTLKRVNQFTGLSAFGTLVDIYEIDITMDPVTVPSTGIITGGQFTEVNPGNSPVTLVQREWALHNRYYESWRLDPVGYDEDTFVTNLNRYTTNKKLTFPSYPVNLRGSMAKRYISTTFIERFGLNFLVLEMSEPHNYEAGDTIVHCPQNSSNNVPFNNYKETTVQEVLPNGDIIVDDLFSNYNSFSGQGCIWSPVKDGLVKKTRIKARATMISSSTTIFFILEARWQCGLPDKNIVSVVSGGPAFMDGKTMLVENTLRGQTPAGSMILDTRTAPQYIEGLSFAEKTELINGTFQVELCIHHQIATNDGYNPILNYNGEYNDKYYNNPVNSDVTNYQVKMEKVIDCDNIINLNDESTLNFKMKRLCTKYDKVNVTWLNNYGAYDSATFDMKDQKSREYKRETYRKTAGKWVGENYLYSNNDKELTDYLVTRDNIGIIDTDWVSEDEHNRLLEILDSPSVYMDIDGEYIPIVIEMDSVDEKTRKNDKLFIFSLEYKITYNKNSIRI